MMRPPAEATHRSSWIDEGWIAAAVGLVQRILDEEGVSTLSLTLSASITRRIKPSRAVLVEHPFGLPMGDLHDDATHVAEDVCHPGASPPLLKRMFE